MQELPGAPGTARQGRTGTSVPATRGGVATQPRAPGHGRPPAAPRAAGHGRLSAATGAPGADVPLATTARAPGQHCLSAALQAPGVDLPLAITAGAPGHHRLSAASIATVSLPAGLHRLRQECLPRVPANPRTPICSPAHQDTARTRTVHSQASPSPCRAGGPQGGQGQAPRLVIAAKASNPAPGPLPVAARMFPGGKGPGDRSIGRTTRWHYPCGFGLSGLRSQPHQVHPAVQAPPHPRSCSTACTGFFHQHPSRAPPRPPNNHSRRTNE